MPNHSLDPLTISHSIRTTGPTQLGFVRLDFAYSKGDQLSAILSVDSISSSGI
jgi:hypothetical protein